MKQETSCGCIIFDKETHSKTLLVYENNRFFWGFPKGHIEGEETELETALREVKEEVGINVKILDEKCRYSMNYIIEDKQVDKTTVLYLAETVDDTNVENQEEEITESKWVTVKEAYDTLTHDNAKEALQKAWYDMQIIKAEKYISSIVKKYTNRGIGTFELQLICRNKVEELLENRKDNWYEDVTQDHYFSWHLKQTIIRAISSLS